MIPGDHYNVLCKFRCPKGFYLNTVQYGGEEYLKAMFSKTGWNGAETDKVSETD